MSRPPIQKIMPVSATASSPPVEIGQNNSILSDPDGRWAARRQEAISEAFEKRMRLESDQRDGAKVSYHDSSQNAGKLSGESDRFGRTEWDENTPFGKHVGFV